MRLPLIPPAELTADQKPLYDDMRAGIATGFNAFKVVREDGALMGPWNPYLHEPAVGAGSWAMTKAINDIGVLPVDAREVAILVVGAHFNAAFELYAHVAVAERLEMSKARLATLVAGSKPGDLSPAESVAYDVARGLCRGGVLPEVIYRVALETFGGRGVAQLIHLVGLYSMVSMTLNGFNVPVPERE